MRVLVDLPENDLKWLDSHANREGKSRAAIVREAVSEYRANAGTDWLDQAFGIWKDREDIGDAVEYQRRLRAEWTREWDPDFEEVRREFPDLFDPPPDDERSEAAE